MFGYKSENGILSINKKESKWVLFMFNSIIDGKSTMWIKNKLDTDGKTDGIAPRRTQNKNWNIGTIEKILSMSSPLFMYHFDVESPAPAVSYLKTGEAGRDCTV